ncbi:aminoethylphosphonate catabolism associated LysR family transcriptional regulator [Variovorax sp. YR266]|jgi:aminoethylphosphonate catabolism LysR family transcriptional regulator|uniref:LysR substrate-binding domain-containing protein n=1 Tax=Variovorax sp. YR266 TaxID=1884386 RepID=UPI0008989432|nr:LysR substrate-binding domain-containing protein [Variovorax sp. YR266]SDZ66307.1 aminoethylphosphonate catabolism associated LysR family transcriptional regulator [Variovorax sp. YR266]
MFHQYYKSIRCFHAVAKTGGFTSAAQYLHIGQPTVTDQVKALEARFNVELFLRSGRGVRLTAAGERLYAITQGLFGQEEEAMLFLESARKLKVGLVRVGAVSPPIALELARNFKEAHPSLDLTVSIGSEESTLRGLQDFSIDVGIVAEPAAAEGLHIAPYRAERIVAVVPEGHAWTQRASITTRDIEHETVILREPGSKTRHRVERACLQQKVNLHCAMEINSREAILHAVANGMGVGFVTQVEFIPLPGLAAVAIDDEQLSISYSLCCLSIRRERPLIDALFAVALEGQAG